jgi:hypothetical protein
VILRRPGMELVIVNVVSATFGKMRFAGKMSGEA